MYGERERMSSFILGKWKTTEEILIRSINAFNSHELSTMQLALEDAKKALKEFIDVLKEESQPVREAFRAKQSMYLTEIEKMAKGVENMKHNLEKPKKQEIKEGGGDKDNFDNALGQAIVREKPNVKWTDIAGLEKAKEALQEAVILPIKFP